MHTVQSTSCEICNNVNEIDHRDGRCDTFKKAAVEYNLLKEHIAKYGDMSMRMPHVPIENKALRSGWVCQCCFLQPSTKGKRHCPDDTQAMYLATETDDEKEYYLREILPGEIEIQSADILQNLARYHDRPTVQADILSRIYTSLTQNTALPVKIWLCKEPEPESTNRMDITSIACRVLSLASKGELLSSDKYMHVVTLLSVLTKYKFATSPYKTMKLETRLLLIDTVTNVVYTISGAFCKNFMGHDKSGIVPSIETVERERLITTESLFVLSVTIYDPTITKFSRRKKTAQEITSIRQDLLHVMINRSSQMMGVVDSTRLGGDEGILEKNVTIKMCVFLKLWVELCTRMETWGDPRIDVDCFFEGHGLQKNLKLVGEKVIQLIGMPHKREFGCIQQQEYMEMLLYVYFLMKDENSNNHAHLNWLYANNIIQHVISCTHGYDMPPEGNFKALYRCMEILMQFINDGQQSTRIHQAGHLRNGPCSGTSLCAACKKHKSTNFETMQCIFFEYTAKRHESGNNLFDLIANGMIGRKNDENDWACKPMKGLVDKSCEMISRMTSDVPDHLLDMLKKLCETRVFDVLLLSLYDYHNPVNNNDATNDDGRPFDGFAAWHALSAMKSVCKYVPNCGNTLIIHVNISVHPTRRLDVLKAELDAKQKEFRVKRANLTANVEFSRLGLEAVLEKEQYELHHLQTEIDEIDNVECIESYIIQTIDPVNLENKWNHSNWEIEVDNVSGLIHDGDVVIENKSKETNLCMMLLEILKTEYPMIDSTQETNLKWSSIQILNIIISKDRDRSVPHTLVWSARPEDHDERVEKRRSDILMQPRNILLKDALELNTHLADDLRLNVLVFNRHDWEVFRQSNHQLFKPIASALWQKGISIGSMAKIGNHYFSVCGVVPMRYNIDMEGVQHVIHTINNSISHLTSTDQPDNAEQTECTETHKRKCNEGLELLRVMVHDVVNIYDHVVVQNDLITLAFRVLKTLNLPQRTHTLGAEVFHNLLHLLDSNPSRMEKYWPMFQRIVSNDSQYLMFGVVSSYGKDASIQQSWELKFACESLIYIDGLLKKMATYKDAQQILNTGGQPIQNLSFAHPKHFLPFLEKTTTLAADNIRHRGHQGLDLLAGLNTLHDILTKRPP